MTYKNHYKFRFYADKNISKTIIMALRKKGLDVLSVDEDDVLKNQEDDFHYTHAKQLNRHLLTYDNDFWNDKRFKLHESPGIILMTSMHHNMVKCVLILRQLIIDCNPNPYPIFLDKTKIKLSPEEFILKFRSYDSHLVKETFRWEELGY